MKNEKQILDKVEKTLHSIDNLKNLESNPFLFTRIKTGLDNPTVNRKTSFTLSLGLKPIVLMIILLINIITAAYFFGSNTNQTTSTSLVSVLQEDYQINQTSNEF